MSILDAGSLNLSFQDGVLQASGDGLSIFVGADVFDASDYPLSHCALCQPGELVNFSGSWLGTGGSVTYQGTTYSTGGAFDPLDVFSVTTQSIVVPPLGAGFSVELPFTMDFSLGYPVNVDATGSGLALVDFVPRTDGWFSSSAVYTLDPPGVGTTTPEPATIFLLAGALLVSGVLKGIERLLACWGAP